MDEKGGEGEETLSARNRQQNSEAPTWMGDLSAPGADVRALETRAAGNGKNQAPDDKWVGPERAPPDVKRCDIAERQGNANESREETRLAPVRGPQGRHQRDTE